MENIFAVVETGGKQYKVTPGASIDVEHLPVDAGDTIELDRVLLVSQGDQTSVGNPTVAGAKVTATVTEQGHGVKIIVFKYKAKTRYARKTGHRQDYTRLAIQQILTDGEVSTHGS